MNIYRMLGSGAGTPAAQDLAERLSAWHDAMVAHERRRDGRCDDECPHADAPLLWGEATEIFGERARELVFLQTRATRGPNRNSIAGAAARLSM